MNPDSNLPDRNFEVSFFYKNFASRLSIEIGADANLSLENNAERKREKERERERKKKRIILLALKETEVEVLKSARYLRVGNGLKNWRRRRHSAFPLPLLFSSPSSLQGGRRGGVGGGMRGNRFQTGKHRSLHTSDIFISKALISGDVYRHSRTERERRTKRQDTGLTTPATPTTATTATSPPSPPPPPPPPDNKNKTKQNKRGEGMGNNKARGEVRR